MKIAVNGRAFGALVAAGMLSACNSDARFNKVVEGITKDSVAVLSQGAQPHHVDSYLIGGNRWEVMFYARPGADPADTLSREMTPVVFDNDLVAGKGWSYWRSKARELSIPVPE